MNKINFALASIVLFCFGCGQNSNKESEFKNIEISSLVSYSEEKFPSYNQNYPPPANYQNPFELSQKYPDTFKVENYPWLAIDFKTNQNLYMEAVLKYCIGGNVEVNFKGQDNKVRKWYHAPWLHDDGRYNANHEYIGNGREYIHGLTRERGTPKFEIHKNQDVELENWAVGMYNEPGGYTLGKVWKSSNEKPEPKNSNFPEGTVSFKLLFTDGTIEKVPFLEGTLEWDANIYVCSPTSSNCTNKKRATRKVRLLQIDIGVKDKRAGNSGWVFGTFMYDASRNGKNVWEKMAPVGLIWGDDSSVTKDLNKDGAFINKELKETYLNASLIEDKNRVYTNQAYIRYHGLGGRLNGPVDNPVSSCVSCHGQAGVNEKGSPMPMGDFRSNRQNFPLTSFKLYFTTPNGGSYERLFNNEKYVTTDYSLQLSAGIRNYYNNELLKTQLVNISKSKNKQLEKFTIQDAKEVINYIKSLPDVTRGE